MATAIRLDGSKNSTVSHVVTVGFDTAVSGINSVGLNAKHVSAYRDALDAAVGQLKGLAPEFQNVTHEDVHDAAMVLARSSNDADALKDTFFGRAASGALGGGLVQAVMAILEKIPV